MNNTSKNPASFLPRQSLNDLNLMNDFLFETMTEKQENAELLARIIVRRSLGIELGHAKVEVEKPLKGINIGKRGIRMDICVTEFKSNRTKQIPSRIFNIEPNNYYDNDLPRRSRFMQSLTDIKLLPSGTSATYLPSIYSIWILPYDPFGENRMIYTVKNVVVENQDIVYNDGITKIFLYINGNHGGSPELKNLLRYLANTNETNAVDEELSALQKIIDDIKCDVKVGEQYMHFVTFEEFAEIRENSGYIRGTEQGIIAAINICKSCSLAKEKTKEQLMSQFTLSDSVAERYLTLHW